MANSAVRWLWYALIGVCLAVVIVTWAFFFPGKYNHGYDKWAQLVILTATIFGYLLKWDWHYKKRAKFWGLYLTAFFGHCAVFLTVFSYGRWPISLLAIVASLETVAIATLIALAMGEKF